MNEFGIRLSIGSIVIVTLLASCQKLPVDTTPEILIKNVNVIPMSQLSIIRNQDVVIRNQKIYRIGKHEAGASTQVIDGTEKYLMPGLSEMHAHVPIPEDGDDEIVRETLFLYLSQGITTIRGMLGQPYHLELKDMINKDLVLSPRLYTSSPSMNGNTIPTTAEAIEKVRQYKTDGYDFLKIHPGIPIAAWDALESTAQEVSMDYAGHVPIEVGLHRAISSGYKTVDHMDGFMEALVPAESDIDRSLTSFFGYHLINEVDRSMIPALVTKMKMAGIAIVPTHTLFTRWFSPKDPGDQVNEPEMKYMSPETRYTWVQSKIRITSDTTYDEAGWMKYTSIRDDILKEIYEQGVTILLGSDAPQVFNVPGFSIHHEMHDMSNVGMSNFDILKSGTTSVADFFGTSDRRGKVKVGYDADLILLNSNPLADISHAQDIEAVFINGKMISSTEIADRLNTIAEKYNTEE